MGSEGSIECKRAVIVLGGIKFQLAILVNGAQPKF